MLEDAVQIEDISPELAKIPAKKLATEVQSLISGTSRIRKMKKTRVPIHAGPTPQLPPSTSTRSI